MPAKNALPSKVREELQKELPEVSLVALQNNRMDISYPINDKGDSADTQLTTFRQIVMDVLNGMDEKFVMIKDSDKLNDDGTIVTMRVRAVDVVPTGKRTPAPVDRNAAINDFITRTTVQAEEYFNQDVSHTIYGILNEANNKRIEEEGTKELVSMLTKQYGASKAEKLAALMAEVLKQEEEKGFEEDAPASTSTEPEAEPEAESTTKSKRGRVTN